MTRGATTPEGNDSIQLRATWRSFASIGCGILGLVLLAVLATRIILFWVYPIPNTTLGVRSLSMGAIASLGLGWFLLDQQLASLKLLAYYYLALVGAYLTAAVFRIALSYHRFGSREFLLIVSGLGVAVVGFRLVKKQAPNG